MNPINEVVGEMKNRPYTMLAIIGLMLAVPYIGRTYATAGELAAARQAVSALDNKLTALQVSVTRTSLEAQLRAIKSELFDIQRKTAEMREQHRTIDAIYFEKIKQLINDQSETERKLAELN